MGNSSLKILVRLFGRLFLFLILTACQSEILTEIESQPVGSITPSPLLLHTDTPTPSVSPVPSQTRLPFLTQAGTQTGTPIKSPTSGVMLPPATSVSIGTPIVYSGQEISRQNYAGLANVAEWGKGSIRGVVFSPDGEFFIVGSAYGLALYDLNDLQSPPLWLAFPEAVFYTEISISEDGYFIKLDYESFSLRGQRFYDLKEKRLTDEVLEINWVKSTTTRSTKNGYTFTSVDEKYSLSAYTIHRVSDQVPVESIRQVLSLPDRRLLFSLNDETIQLSEEMTSEPIGCDPEFFNIPSEVFFPIPSLPKKAEFSSDGSSLAVLYQPDELVGVKRFNTLRVYSMDGGRLVGKIGSFEDPVEDFTYSPDGKTILVGFLNGSIQLWNVMENELVFNAWHFNAPVLDLKYSPDGKYVILERQGSVEVRLSSSGTLVNRYAASAVDVSPKQNQIAIGTKDGGLRVINLDSGENQMEILAHQGEVQAVAFSEDGREITSSGRDCTISNWETGSGKFRFYFEEQGFYASREEGQFARSLFYDLEYIPGTGQLIGFGTWTGAAVWDGKDGKSQFFLLISQEENGRGLLPLWPLKPSYFGYDVKKGEFYINRFSYDLETGEQIAEISLPDNFPDDCSSDGVIMLDGGLILSGGYGSRDGQVCLLDGNTYEFLSYLPVIKNVALYGQIVGKIYLSPDGKQLLVQLAEGVVYVYQVVQGE